MTRRPGYTLIELLVATASASVLMVGLSTAIFASGRAMDFDNGSTVRRNESGGVIGRVLAELEEARGFTVLNATIAEFTVPDRTGDGLEETLRYEWSGMVGDPLTRSINGGASHVLLPDVTLLNFRALTRRVAATGVENAPNPNAPVLRRWDWERQADSETSIDLPTPGGVVAGELLLAALSIDGDQESSLAAPADWNVLDVGNGARDVTLMVAWKIATASEPATTQWTWGRGEQALGWVMRISNQGSSPPAIVTATGDAGLQAECPAASVGGDDALVMRIGAFDDDDITIGDVGMPGQVPVLMHRSGTRHGSVSAGCAYAVQPLAGSAPAASFTLSREEEYRTSTVVILP